MGGKSEERICHGPTGIVQDKGNKENSNNVYRTSYTLDNFSVTF